MYLLCVGLAELIGRHWEDEGGGSSYLEQLFSGTGEDVSYRRDNKVNSWCALQTVWSFCKISQSGFSLVWSKRATDDLNVCSWDSLWLASAKALLTRASSSLKFCLSIKNNENRNEFLITATYVDNGFITQSSVIWRIHRRSCSSFVRWQLREQSALFVFQTQNSCL